LLDWVVNVNISKYVRAADWRVTQEVGVSTG